MINRKIPLAQEKKYLCWVLSSQNSESWNTQPLKRASFVSASLILATSPDCWGLHLCWPAVWGGGKGMEGNGGGHQLLHRCRRFLPGCACCSTNPEPSPSATGEKSTDISATNRNLHRLLGGKGYFSSHLGETTLLLVFTGTERSTQLMLLQL